MEMGRKMGMGKGGKWGASDFLLGRPVAADEGDDPSTTYLRC